MCMEEGRESVRGKKNYIHKSAVKWSMATDLEEIGGLFLYQQSLQKASHRNYHLQLRFYYQFNDLSKWRLKTWREK